MTDIEKALADMLAKIVNRATRPRVTDSTGQESQSVRKGLIDEARALLATLQR